MTLILAESASNGWILDIVFFGILLLGIGIGAGVGLVRSVTKIVGTIASIILAVLCCVPFKNLLETIFGMETAISNGIGGHPLIGSWISVAISFVILAIGIRLAAWLIGFLGKSLIKKSKGLNAVDRFLGAVLGLVEALLLLFFLLAICKWINAENVNAFIDTSYVVKAIYHWNWFEQMASFSFIRGGEAQPTGRL